ncbi:MAG: 30S ribosomal protein S6 [Desulfovibrio sp.]|jgi:small subunit ribosomal protein S6|nr:30S ribosomal protein S6 [Desulfovibrio sp.]
MRRFETLLLFSPELSTESRNGVLGGFKDIIGREGGTLLAEDNWGMRDLAYPVKKQMRGWYTRLEYAAPPTMIAEFERNIRISEDVFKFLTVKLDDAGVPAGNEKEEEETA